MRSVDVRPAIQTSLRQTFRRHPELPTWGVVGCAWVILIIAHGWAGLLPSEMVVHHQPQSSSRIAPTASLIDALPMLFLMNVAMMVPGAIPAVRHVTSNSLRRRRQRAAASFLGAYLCLWMMFGVVAWVFADLAARAVGVGTVAVAALAVAAIWQLLPARQSWLDRCHRTVPLPPRGRLAVMGCLRFGAIHGRWCLCLCWPMMMVMMVAPLPAVLWMAVITAVITGEKYLRRPYRWSTALAFLLGAVALNVALAG